MISSCLKRSASIFDAHRASTSGATSIISEDAEERASVDGPRRFHCKRVRSLDECVFEDLEVEGRP